MNLKLFEVAGTHIFSMSAIVMVLFFVFAIIVVGYLLGKINIKGVSLGTAAIFLVALVVGHFKGVAFGENGIAYPEFRSDPVRDLRWSDCRSYLL